MARATARAARRGAVRRPVLTRSLAIAAAVGTALNLINQGDALLAGRELNWLKIGLTYGVPFLVATYGAYCALRVRE